MFFPISLSRTQRLSEASWPPDVYALPDAGTGEGVPFQSLPDAATAHRDRTRAVSDRAPDQDLVPEPQDEAEERATCGQGDQRAGAARTRGTRSHEAATAAAAAGRQQIKQNGPSCAAPSPPRLAQTVVGHNGSRSGRR